MRETFNLTCNIQLELHTFTEPLHLYQDQEGGDVLRPHGLPPHQLERHVRLAPAGDHRQAGGRHHRCQHGEEGGAGRQSDQGGFREVQEQICPTKLPQRRGD